jgi:hypothetical protein
MAPLYDLLATRFYPDIHDKLAMYVDEVQKADRVTCERIVNEAVRWGMRRERAEWIVDDVVERLGAAEIAGVPDALLHLIEERAERMRAR